MAGAVLPASIGLVPIAISALGGAIAMFVTGCVKFERVGYALSAKVIVLVAASIAVGRIVLDSGAAEWISQLIAGGLQYLPPAGVLAAVMLFVTVLTNFASNTTAAAVGTPIAFSLGQHSAFRRAAGAGGAVRVQPLLRNARRLPDQHADHVGGGLQIRRLHAHRAAAGRYHDRDAVGAAGRPLQSLLTRDERDRFVRRPSVFCAPFSLRAFDPLSFGLARSPVYRSQPPHGHRTFLERSRTGRCPSASKAPDGG
jgi:hypothetical protein